MKTVNLEKFTETATIKGVEVSGFSYSTLDLIKIAVNSAPQGGFAVSDMMDRLRITKVINELEEDATEVQFEDSDYKNLQKYLESARWHFISENIVKVIQSFKG